MWNLLPFSYVFNYTKLKKNLQEICYGEKNVIVGLQYMCYN